MKTNKPFFLATAILLVAYVLSACGGLPLQDEQSSGEQAGIKVRASTVAYTGVIDTINGTEWTVNGQVISVAPEVVQDGPFQAGDTIKIEANVEQDGSLTVLSVEAPSASDLTDLPPLGDDNDNGNDNDDDNDNDNGNDNDNDANDNDDDDANGNDNDDDNGNDNDNDNGNDNDDDNGNDNGNDNDDSNDNDDNDNDDDSNDNDDDDDNDNDDDDNDDDDDDD